MKVFRALFIFLLIIVIVGGLGYIAWNISSGQYNSIAEMLPWNTTQNSNTQGNMTGHGSMTPSTGGYAQNSAGQAYSARVLQNKEKLEEIQGMVNNAIDLITMDPYSRVTVPSNMNNMQTPETQGNTGTINIYPNGTNSVTVAPPTAGTGTTAAGTTGTTAAAGTPATGNMNMPVGNYVYDQAKLEQLHRGIVRLAQGMMYLTQLNDELTIQASSINTNTSYEVYMDRYAQVLKNKAKLNNAVASINQATELVNVNPYASANGYQYNSQYMEQMHRGIYSLAQAMVLANDLNEDLTAQMVQNITNAQSILNGGNGMANMSGMNNNSGWSGIFNPTSISTVFNIILIIMVILLIISVFGVIGNILKGTNKNTEKTQTKNDTDL